MGLPLREQELVALDGRGNGAEAEEPARLRAEVDRLRKELEAERATVSALNAQLTVMSRQLDAARLSAERGVLRRKRR